MQPKGEKLRKAINWVTETKNDFPQKEIISIVNEANMKFDLNPADSEFLIKFFRDNKEAQV
ncbi:MAG: hypothetical protein EOM04_01850 [Clostridia bacterium]|jgi:hypothetical protein|nr:hypothetical protein [Clostridia bacterium]